MRLAIKSTLSAALVCAALGFISGIAVCRISDATKVVVDMQQRKAQPSMIIPQRSVTATNVTPVASAVPNESCHGTNTTTKTDLPISNNPVRTTGVLNTKKNYSSWCPTAVCLDSDLCHPCQRRFLLLFATGRSASTTLMYMLGTLPGVRMGGENAGTFNKFWNMVHNVRTNPSFQAGAKIQHAWGHNPVPEGAYSCVGQHMMETINPPKTMANGSLLVQDDSDTIVGFKTIRLLDGTEDPNIDRYRFPFVKEIFPCARILINIRSNVTQQAASQAKTFGVDGTLAEMQAKNQRMIKLQGIFGRDYARLLDSSDWTKNVTALNEVVEWLGFSKECFFQSLLEFNTKEYTNGKTTRMPIHPGCKYLGG